MPDSQTNLSYAWPSMPTDSPIGGYGAMEPP